MENLTEMQLIPILWDWLEYKNEMERVSVPKSTKDSNRYKVSAIVKLLSEDAVSNRTIRKLASTPTQYSYGYRLARLFKSAVKWGVKTGRIKVAPEIDMRLPEPKFDHCRVHLTNEQIEQINDIPLEGKLLEARRLYMFQQLTGLAYCDMKNFCKRMRRADTDKNRWAVINRQKTGKPAYIKLNDTVLKEIEWLSTVNIPCLQTYNNRLHEIEQICGIVIRSQTGNTKTLTTHVGRKTFAQNHGKNGESHRAIGMQMGVQDKSLYGSYMEQNTDILDALLAS